MNHTAPNTLPKFDEDGFLLNSASWDVSVAEWIAQQDGIFQLTEKHWDVIHILRNYYEKYGTVPGLHHVCHMQHIDEMEFDHLFGHSFKEACRIAGIPNPGEEAKAYM